ncbi:hypothetical protein Tco_0250502 [Tanacetum coccineum]
MYNKSRGCSKGGLVDKFFHDPNKTPDSSQRPPIVCAKCGNPVDGPYYRGCALWRKKLKDVWFTICNENGIYQDLLNTYESSDDNTNIVNAPQEPFVVKQDPGENSSQNPPQIDHDCCYECGDSLDVIFCQRCTCKSCGKGAHIGYNCPPKAPIISNPEPCNQTIDELPQTLPSFDPTCYSEKENSLPYVSKPNFVDDSPNVFNPPPQPPMYSCEFCGNDALYGHYCTPQVPFIYLEPCYNQDFNFPHDFHDFQQQYLCCENCGGPHETYQCQPMNEDYYHKQNSCYDPNSFGFDQFQPPQCNINHPILNAQNDLLNSQNKLLEQITSIPVCYDDDDDEESSTPLKDIIMSGLPSCVAITPDLPKTDSLLMEDEHLSTILETESDEFIKSSVENLVQNPNEFEDASDGVCDLPISDDFPKSHLVSFSNPLFDINDDCTSSDDESFSEEDVPMKNFKIFSNPLFDLDEEIVSTKVNLIQNEVLESITSIPPGIDSFNAESNLIESLLNQNTLIDSSSKIDSLLDEFAGEVTLLKSIPPGIDDDNLDPEEDFNSDVSDAITESFSPSPILVKDSDSLMEEIDLFLTSNDSMPPGIETDDYDSEGDILFFEELLTNDSLSLPEHESFHFESDYDPSFPRPPAKPPDDDEIETDTGLLTTKVVGDISEHYVLIPRLLPTQPTLCPVIQTFLPF